MNSNNGNSFTSMPQNNSNNYNNVTRNPAGSRQPSDIDEDKKGKSKYLKMTIIEYDYTLIS
jgi:hypothetical protein